MVIDFGGHVLRTVGSGQGAGASRFSFPFGVAIDPRGGSSWPTTSTSASSLRSAARLGPGPLGQLRHRSRPARLPPARSPGHGRPALRHEHRQRPHRRLQPGREAAALLGRSPRARPVQRAARRRRRRQRHPRRRRLHERAPGAARSRRLDRVVWGSTYPGPTILRGPSRSPSTPPATPTCSTSAARGSSSSPAGRACRPARSPTSAAAPRNCSTRRRCDRRDRRDHRRRHRQPAHRALRHRRDVPRCVDRTDQVRGVAVGRTAARVRRGATTGSPCTTGRPATSGGSAARAHARQLSAPSRIALDAGGNVRVADRGDDRIQKFAPDGGRRDFRRARPGAGRFVNPTGIIVDCHGLLTVTDAATTASTSSARHPHGACLGASRRSATRRRRASPTLPAPLDPT